MKRIIKVEASYSGVLPVASFSNLRPGFSASMEFEQEFGTEEEVALAIEGAQERLSAISYRAFENEAMKARIMKVKEDLKNFRFYPVPDTEDQYPSVTSINGYDKEFHVSDEDLVIYAAQGNCYDMEIRNFAKTGIWKPFSEIVECSADYFILKTRKLSSGKRLSTDSCKFREFLEKYPITDLQSIEKPVFNHQYRYAGTPDLLGVYNGIKTLVSIKRTKSEVDNLIQESAYSKCVGMEDVKQMMVVEMKNEDDGGNKQGFSKPIVSSEADRYFELFLRKRNDVKRIYGV